MTEQMICPSNIQNIMKSNREEKKVKSITFSTGSFFKAERYTYQTNMDMENMGMVRDIYFEQGEIENMHDVHISFDDYTIMFPSVKIEQITFENA